MVGQKSVHAQTCFDGNFIGADYGITEDLAGDLPDAWQEFNAKFIPVFLASYPAKTKIAAGLACGMLWTIAKGIQKGDIVLWGQPVACCVVQHTSDTPILPLSGCRLRVSSSKL
jgi:restriction system protein